MFTAPFLVENGEKLTPFILKVVHELVHAKSPLSLYDNNPRPTVDHFHGLDMHKHMTTTHNGLHIFTGNLFS